MAATVHSHRSLIETLEDRSFDRPPALVANAHITGLGVARALDAHGVDVIAIDRSDGGVAPPSNAVDVAGTVTYPLDDQAGFVNDVAAIVDAVGQPVVAFGCMDEWVHAFAEAPLEGLVCPFADAEVVDRVLNKSSLYRLADELGVPYPETYRLAEHDLDTVIEALSFPLVIKPERKREFEEAVGTNVVEVEDRSALEAIVDRAAEHDVAVMAQEAVPIATGEDRSFVSYVPPDGTIDDALGLVGNPVVRAPRSFGTSCIVDRVDDPTIESRALAVLEAAGYHGISEAEFVYDTDRQEHVLLDINTRPWKWISAPVAAGLNLPYAAYADAVGRERPTPGDPEDVRWVALRDYLALVGAGEVGAVITPAQHRQLLDGTFTASDSGLTTAVYRPADPMPAVGQLEAELGDESYYCSC